MVGLLCGLSVILLGSGDDLISDAAAGNAHSQVLLAMELLEEPSPANRTQSFYWLDVAARQDLSYAQLKLGDLYLSMRDIPHRREMAFMWTIIAFSDDDLVDWYNEQRGFSWSHRTRIRTRANGLSDERLRVVEEAASRCIESGFEICGVDSVRFEFLSIDDTYQYLMAQIDQQGLSATQDAANQARQQLLARMSEHVSAEALPQNSLLTGRLNAVADFIEISEHRASTQYPNLRRQGRRFVGLALLGAALSGTLVLSNYVWRWWKRRTKK